MASSDVGYNAAGAALDFTTVAAWWATVSSGDAATIYYADANKNRIWNNQAVNAGVSTTTITSITGGLTKRRVIFNCITHWYFMGGNLSGHASQETISNLTLFCHDTSNKYGVTYNDTTGGGGGMVFDQLAVGPGWDIGIYVRGDNGVCQVQNSCSFGNTHGVYGPNSAQKFYFLSCIGNASTGVHAANQAHTITNCVAMWNSTADFNSTGAATVTYSFSSDATAGAGAGCVNNLTDADLGWWHDNSENGQIDYRIISTSDAYHAGTPIAGITTDCDDNARDGINPSIGWHEGTAVAYPSPSGDAPTCLGAIDAAPNAQGCILVRFFEMVCASGTVPYRYDIHVKQLSDGALTKAEIDTGDYFSRAIYQEDIAGQPDTTVSPPIGPAIVSALIAFEAYSQHNDNVHLFTNRQYQVAVRAVAIDATDTIFEDDNDEVVVSYSSGYQGIQWMHILSWPCLTLCADQEIAIAGTPNVSVGVTSTPPVEFADDAELDINILDWPQLDAHIHRNRGG